jgi:hypothetical protein
MIGLLFHGLADYVHDEFEGRRPIATPPSEMP